jgi:hypothetical protein
MSKNRLLDKLEILIVVFICFAGILYFEIYLLFNKVEYSKKVYYEYVHRPINLRPAKRIRLKNVFRKILPPLRV